MLRWILRTGSAFLVVAFLGGFAVHSTLWQNAATDPSKNAHRMGATVASVTSEKDASPFHQSLSNKSSLSTEEAPRKPLLDFFSSAHHASFQGIRPRHASGAGGDDLSDESGHESILKSLDVKAHSRRLPTFEGDIPQDPIQRGPFLRGPPDIFVAEETSDPTASPTAETTEVPSTLPTVSPSTSPPTRSPNDSPSSPPSTTQATPAPSSPPTPLPSLGPTQGPTAGPTPGETPRPSAFPTLTEATQPPSLPPSPGPTPGPSAGPTPGETPHPSASPTVTEATQPPSLPPSPGPTPGPSAGPTPGPTFTTSTSPATTCPNDATLVDEMAANFVPFESNPITVLAQHGDNVTFAVGQTWSDGLLCLISTHFENSSGTFTCPSATNVGPGEFAKYTAVCHAGYALVQLFVYEANLTTSGSPDIPPVCEQTEAANTHKYEFQIPCETVQQDLDCPSPETYVCDELVTVLSTEHFGTASQVDSWLFGKPDGDAEDPYLVLDSDNSEISKVYTVPLDATRVLFQFDLLEIHGQAPRVVLVRVQDYYLNVTAALDQETVAWDFAGDISVSIQRSDPTRLRVSTAIPAPLYLPNGRLSLGVRSTSEAAVGFDHVRLLAVCGAA